MKRIFWTRQLPIALLVAGFVMAVSAWQTNPGSTPQTTRDTVPDEKKAKDIDEALERSQKEMQKAIEELNQNSVKMKEQMEKAIKEVDMAKVQAQLDKALKEVDLEKMKVDLQKSLSALDAQNIKAELDKAIKEIDAEKIQAEIKESLAQVNTKQMQEDLKKLQEVDMKKLQDELSNMKPELEKAIGEARAGMEKARTEMAGYRNLMDGLEKDGLLDKKSDYTIEWKKGALSINGKKQPASVVNKYNDFLKNHEEFIIKKNEDGFNINKN